MAQFWIEVIEEDEIMLLQTKPEGASTYEEIPPPFYVHPGEIEDFEQLKLLNGNVIELDFETKKWTEVEREES